MRFAPCAALLLCVASASTIPETRAESPVTLPTTRDGSHDFDFKLGTWRTHIRRIPDPFDSPAKSMELNGQVTVEKVWNGRAFLEQIEADGPKGHWQALTLFLYNPQAHQWSQSFINSAMGTLATPTIGSFRDGRGELFSNDTFKDRAILVRGVWSDIKSNSHRYEESYSDDGGRTWRPAFVGDLTRSPDSASTAVPAPADASHDFDFDFGNWHTHSSRLLHPLTGSKEWVELDGTTSVRQVWGGRANLAEYKAEGSTGVVELLALRWYNPNTHQWQIDFATPGVGMLGIPGVGQFRNGRGDFYDYEMVNGHYVLVRFSIWKITADTAQSEQAFSADGGQTWEVNWINRYTRVKQ